MHTNYDRKTPIKMYCDAAKKLYISEIRIKIPWTYYKIINHKKAPPFFSHYNQTKKNFCNMSL